MISEGRSVPALALALLLLTSCGLVGLEPSRSQPTGILVGEGQLDGAHWSVTVDRRGELLCFERPVHQEQSCWSPIEAPRAPLGSITVPGESNPPSALPKVVDGIVRLDVARVRIESDAGNAEARVVGLQALAISANAFAVALPANARITALVALAADGRELERRPW